MAKVEQQSAGFFFRIFLALLLLFLVGISGNGEICQETQSGEKHCAEYSIPLVVVWQVGKTLAEGHGVVTALFTFVLAWSTYLLWKATNNLWVSANRQEEISRQRERAYVCGGGPWREVTERHPDPDTVFMTIQNNGRTPGFLKRIDWGLCDPHEFPLDEPVSELIEKKRIKTKKARGEDVIPGDNVTRAVHPARFQWSENRGKIFYGRYVYSDIFGDWHLSTFKLQLHDTIKPGSDAVEGCYSDWQDIAPNDHHKYRDA